MEKSFIQAINPPASISGGFSLEVTVHNTSDEVWESSRLNPVNVAYHWLDEDWNMVVFDGKRTPLPQGGIPQGGTAKITAQIAPPPNPGKHRLFLTLVREGVAWFESKSQFSPNILNIVVEDEQPVLVSAKYGQLWVMPSDTVIGASLLQNGCFEEAIIIDVTNFLTKKYSFSPKQFVDIGANIGTHVIYALHQRVFETGIAIEAEPLNYMLLDRNIRHNKMDSRVKRLHYAVSNRDGTITMEQAPDNRGDHRIRSLPDGAVPDLYNEVARETVSLVSDTLDSLNLEFQLDIGPHSLIWIDTQGHEGHVLEGAKSLIEGNFLRFLACELWPYGLERAGGKEKFFDFLSNCSAIYDLHQPDWQNARPLRCEILVQTYEELLRGGVGHTDLLCII